MRSGKNTGKKFVFTTFQRVTYMWLPEAGSYVRTLFKSSEFLFCVDSIILNAYAFLSNYLGLVLLCIVIVVNKTI